MIYFNEKNAINFSHSTKSENRHTVCELLTLEGDTLKPFATGIAQCHPKDNFCKAVGRKRSLKRALENAGFDKSVRTQVWNAYREHCN